MRKEICFGIGLVIPDRHDEIQIAFSLLLYPEKPRYLDLLRCNKFGGHGMAGMVFDTVVCSLLASRVRSVFGWHSRVQFICDIVTFPISHAAHNRFSFSIRFQNR